MTTEKAYFGYEKRLEEKLTAEPFPGTLGEFMSILNIRTIERDHAQAEVERLTALNAELMANAHDLRKLAGCKQTAIEELLAALEEIAGWLLPTGRDAQDIARTVLTKVKEGK